MSNRDLTKINFQPEYRTGSMNQPSDLLRLGLSNSKKYRRASGYFSSSVFNLFREETIEFAKSGGCIDLMCSPVMSENDLRQLSDGYDTKEKVVSSILDEIQLIGEMKDSEVSLSFVATLIHLSILHVRLVFFEDGKGIFHDKSGYFRDEKQNFLSFSGSANESSTAFSGSGNFERLSVFSSWKDSDQERCQSNIGYVDDLWLGQIPSLNVLDFPAVAKDVLKTYCRNDLSDFDAHFRVVTADFPKSKQLMPHQSLAISNWKNAGRRGILKHATGSGKTITAISAIKEHRDTGSPSLVLVPSKLLLDQWYEELSSEIYDVLILRCGGGHVTWKKNKALTQMFQQSPSNMAGGVVLAVNDTASSGQFLCQIVNEQNVLVIADEVHALGSEKNSAVFSRNFQFRLGLSATPERYRDLDGTKRIFDFFHGVVEPEDSLKDALNSGRLVPYDYFPLVTALTAAEEEAWSAITTKIINYVRFRDIEKKSLQKDPVLSRLLINRSRIAKKAVAKAQQVTKVLEENFEAGQHWLVYCEDTEQLNAINTILLERQIKPFIYTSTLEGSPKQELDAFSNQGGILLSIRCLDEGVDIPKISHAIIAASSQNPRQFIQRRGRVLRTAPGKIFAVVFDCIVVPGVASTTTKFDGLILSEVRRAIEFAATARNSVSAESTLRNILIRLGTDPETVMQDLDGDEETDE